MTEAVVSNGIHERREEMVILRDPIEKREGRGVKGKKLYGGGF